ncbi:MAG TPA: hypothetical protein VF725_08790 [Ktedonobacterales bacterium]|jgi:hypothetical protein
MGKLIDKLRRIGQGGSGSFGFGGRGQSVGGPARPAAVVVTLGASEVAAAEAAAKAGVDAVIIASWKPGADISAIKTALESASTLWGVEYDGGQDDDVVGAAQKAGAGFLTLGPDAPASALYDKAEGFDRIVTLTVPQSEMDLLHYRIANSLPAQAGMTPLPIGVADLPSLPLSQVTRLALLTATARLPMFAVVDDVPTLRATRMLVRLGFDGVVIAGAGMSASQVGKQIGAVRADLETIPVNEALEHEGVSLSGLMGASGLSAQPGRREPDTDPDHE